MTGVGSLSPSPPAVASPEQLPFAARPSVSVAICAYTVARVDDLRAAIAGVLAQTWAAHEVLVVVDHCEELEQRLGTASGPVRVLRNTGTPGLSGARNTAVGVASGEIVAFLDDDAVPERDWLERLTSRFDSPAVIGAGGEVLPRWTDERPRWFPPEFDWVVGCTYRGMPAPDGRVRNPVGAGMALRRSIFKELGGFRVDLGRVGAGAAGTEETELCIRAAQRWREAEFVFEPTARVHHRVPRARATVGYFLRRCRAEGRSKAAMVDGVGISSGLAAERSYVTHVLPAAVLAYLARPGRDWAPARAAMVIAGLASTVLGYVEGRVRGR